uniref:SSD domain-containing protein n=1 Tax=Timema douglasi TaxID=61478 RepID=A0A7R8VDP6_TIMDO|nr:unnamed protein product [Timema douglasi]
MPGSGCIICVGTCHHWTILTSFLRIPGLKRARSDPSLVPLVTGRFGRVIVIPKHGKDMLKKEIWAELRLLDQMIQNATVHWDGDGSDPETFTYGDVCARWIDQCFFNDILNLDYVIEEVESGELNLTFPIMFNPVTWDAHTFPVYFGGTVVGEDSIIIEVPSVQFVYFVTADTKRQDSRGAAWEETFLRVVGDAEDRGVFQHISTARFASRTLDIELERNTRTVIPFFSTTFIVMAVFSITSCMMADWVRSKPWLGFMGNISACMGTAAAFGVVMYLGVEFIGINLAAPFLMLGIGIDDTFVMLAAWRRTSVKMDVPERMGQMLSEAAVSITITSFTDMISFFIGIFSPFPSVRIFCTYSGFAVCFTFLWHISFFAACVAVAGYAEQKNLHSLVCIKVEPLSRSGEYWVSLNSMVESLSHSGEYWVSLHSMMTIKVEPLSHSGDYWASLHSMMTIKVEPLSHSGEYWASLHSMMTIKVEPLSHSGEYWVSLHSMLTIKVEPLSHSGEYWASLHSMITIKVEPLSHSGDYWASLHSMMTIKVEPLSHSGEYWVSLHFMMTIKVEPLSHFGEYWASLHSMMTINVEPLSPSGDYWASLHSMMTIKVEPLYHSGEYLVSLHSMMTIKVEPLSHSGEYWASLHSMMTIKCGAVVSLW